MVTADNSTTLLMTMLGSFPAADVTTFQMFHDAHHQRSLSPWTTSGVECCPDYRLPVDGSSSDQFTPQEYPTATKLPPRQLHWVSSNTHGYDMPPTALSYDNVEAIQTTGQHHGQQRTPVTATTTNSGWSSQFTQVIPQNLVTTHCSTSHHQLPPLMFHDPSTKSYFVDCSLKRTADDDALMQSVSGRGQFSNTSSTVTSPGCSSYGVPTANSYSSGSGVKSDPDGPSEWQRTTLPIVWHHNPVSDVSVKTDSGPQIAYSTTVPYTSVGVPLDWSMACEQNQIQPVKVSPSTSIGEWNSHNVVLSLYNTVQ